MLTTEQLLDIAQTRIQKALDFRETGQPEAARTELQHLVGDLVKGLHEIDTQQPDPKKQDGDTRTG